MNLFQKERIVDLVVKNHGPKYQNVGLFAKYVIKQFEKTNKTKLIFNYKKVFKTLGLSDYFENEFDSSFFVAAAVITLNQIGFTFSSQKANKQMIISKRDI